MKNKTIGFIGGGNMATAIIGGILQSGIAAKEQLIAADTSENALAALQERFGIRTTHSNQESIAAGTSRQAIDSLFGQEIKLIRAMPNTPALVGEGMSALCANSRVSEAELAEIRSIFSSFGACEVVSESMIDTVVGVSGSSPAYVYLFIEAMADAAVADGMPRAQAYRFAAQSVLGSAKMVLETGSHPGALKDAVCSPGGTTIEAVAILEEEGMRHAVIRAQRACVQKSKDMGKLT